MKKTCLLLLLLAMLSGCARYSLVNSETYYDADMSKYMGYRVVDASASALPAGMSLETLGEIVSAIKHQMFMRGFIEDKQSALLINIGVTVHDVMSPDTQPKTKHRHKATTGSYYSVRYPHFIMPRDSYWTDPALYTRVIKGIYNEGVLTIDMIDTRLMKPMYSSSVSGIIDHTEGKYLDSLGINDAVDVMFSKFPVVAKQMAQQ